MRLSTAESLLVIFLPSQVQFRQTRLWKGETCQQNFLQKSN